MILSPFQRSEIQSQFYLTDHKILAGCTIRRCSREGPFLASPPATRLVTEPPQPPSPWLRLSLCIFSLCLPCEDNYDLFKAHPDNEEEPPFPKSLKIIMDAKSSVQSDSHGVPGDKEWGLFKGPLSSLTLISAELANFLLL